MPPDPPQPAPGEPRPTAERDAEELLDAHRPLLRYDPQDQYRVISARSMVDNPGNLLLDGDDRILARAGGPEDDAEPVPRLTFELLADHAGRPRPDLEQMAQAPASAAAARRMQDPAHAFARRVHGRVCRLPDGSAWLQYWLFYYYNPKNLRGFGKHEGDWELVQLHVDPSGTPTAATYAQHEFGEAREWREVEVKNGHAVVYVAALSHASYFRRRTYPYAVLKRYLPIGIDHALGGTSPGQPAGPEELPVVEILPEDGWPLWPGRWGSGDRAVRIFGGIGQGPRSPGCQAPKWRHPQVFHDDQGKFGHTLRRLAGRLTRFLGNLFFPRPPDIESAQLTGGELTVAYTVQRSLTRRTKYVLLTVNQAEGAQLVLVSRMVRAGRGRRRATVRLPGSPGPLRVWASAFNGSRQRSDLASREVT